MTYAALGRHIAPRKAAAQRCSGSDRIEDSVFHIYLRIVSRRVVPPPFMDGTGLEVQRPIGDSS